MTGIKEGRTGDHAKAGPLEALAYLVPTLLIAAILARAAWVRTLGEGTSIAGAIGAASAYVIIPLIVYAIAGRKGRTRGARFAFWTTVVMLLVSLLEASKRVASQTVTRTERAELVSVTEGERAGLEIGPDTIRHTAFMFSLPAPGPRFERDNATQRRVDSVMASCAALPLWHPGHSHRAIGAARSPFRRSRSAVRGRPPGEADFRTYAAGVRGESTRIHRRILLDSLVWRARDGEFRLETESAEGVYLQSRCLQRPWNTGGLIVCRPHRRSRPTGPRVRPQRAGVLQPLNLPPQTG